MKDGLRIACFIMGILSLPVTMDLENPNLWNFLNGFVHRIFTAALLIVPIIL